jgi:tetratricopeptide (TPR) repeat protein
VKGKTTHPLIGRDAAMVTLRRVVRTVAGSKARGQSGTLAIIGEPGMGKSRLLNEAALLAHQADLRFIAIRGSELIREVPFGCFMPPFRYLAGILGEDTPALARSAGLSDDEAACLGTLLDDDAAEMRALPPDERNRLVRATIAAVLRLAVRRVPLLLLVDDVQYLDIETLGLMGELARKKLVPGLGLVMAGRTEAELDLSALPGEMVRLAPLEPEASRRLAEAILDQGAAAAGLVEQIAARAGGLPLAIEEFATLVANRPAGIEAGTGEGTASGERLPARLESLLLHRIDMLDLETLELCLKFCAMGPSLSLERLRRLAPMIGGNLDRAIETLVERRILEIDFSGHIRFTHQLVQEAGYRTLSRRQRSDLHSALYAALHADMAATDRTAAGRASHAELAHHAEAAGLFDDALKHLWKACEEAIAIAAIETVHAIYRRAHAICARMGPAGGAPAARFALLAFDALQQLSLEQETRADMLALTNGTVDFGPEVRTIAQINMALLEWIDGSSRSARRFLTAAEEGLRETESFPRRVYAELVSAYVDYSLAEPRKALDRLDRLTAEMRERHAGGETFGAIVVIPHILALSFGVWYATDLGEQDRASAWIAEATAISETLEHDYSRFVTHLSHGYFRYRAGQLDEAIAILREAHDCCIAQKFFGFEPVSVSWLALCLIERGEIDEASRILSDSIDRGPFVRVKTSATYYHYEARCRLELAHGRQAEAMALANAALRHCRDNEELLHELHARVLREEVLARSEDPGARERHAIRAELARRVGALGLVPLRARIDALGGAPNMGAAA